MSDIRVTYTGLISFVAAIVTAAAGVIFTLIITRSLSTEEFGTWGLIIGMITYVMMIGLVISFWSTRETARGIESGKTAVFASMILSIGAIAVYVIISYLMGYQTKVDLNILVLASILLPVMFLNGILTAINLGWKPHAISYGTLSFGVSQIPFAFVLVYILDLGVSGVIFTNLFAYFTSIIILYIYAHSKITEEFKKIFIKKWLKLFWLPLYPGLGILVDGLGIAIFSIMTESVIGLAFWTAALVTPSIISHSALISRAVYPKLLEGGTREFVQDNLRHLFYFAFPLTALVIVFAKPALFALNPIYETAFIVAIILSGRNFFLVFTNIFILNLGGVERVDVDEKATFRNYIKSKLFFPHTLRLIQAGSSMIILTVGLIFLIKNGSSDINLLIYWATIGLITQIPLTVYLYKLMKKDLSFKLDLNNIFKYLILSIAIFGIIYLLTEQFLIYDEKIVNFVPSLLLFVSIGIFGYLGATYAIDFKTRNLFNAIIHEIRGKIF